MTTRSIARFFFGNRLLNLVQHEFLSKLSLKVLRRTRFQRRLLLVGSDALLLPFAVWLSFWLRTAHSLHPSLTDGSWWLILAVTPIGLLFYSLSGQYRGLTRYVGSRAFYQLTLRNCLLVLILVACGGLARLPMPPVNSWVLLLLLLTSLTALVRFALRDGLMSLQSKSTNGLARVAIYGAGVAGVQLAAALRLANTHSVDLFIDDDASLWQHSINGVLIKPPQVLHELAHSVDQVLLAIPSLSRSKRRQIVDSLQELGIPVLQVPSMEEITSGRARIDALRPIQVEELLGRDPITPDPELLGPCIEGVSVCVTGAGGSIGSELCRQILALRPTRLVLLDRSEPSLYKIHQELTSSVPSKIEIVPVLGSVTNLSLVEHCFREHSVEVAFHAAAYKHVPLVEVNPLAGLANNVLGTRILCEAARRSNLRQLVLISSDKAVRPANVMGASKRLAELVLQAQPACSTRFSMVRFGNVLGSSGSVVPLFRRQIADGGPLTLTHPEIIRYFMTIPEAAQLVIQATVLAKGGDVFLLDMGEPVRIKSLAEQMVCLSGLSVKDFNNPSGDIEIVYTGLRPGEKLFEELLIDAESEPTQHPLIFRAQERSLRPEVLWPQLDALEAVLREQNSQAALAILSSLVPEWQSPQLLNKHS